MTTETWSERHVARSADVLLGPPLMRGASKVHLIKNCANGRRYELGAKEYFILLRMDGSSSLGDIGTAYADEFGRRLGDASWEQLLKLLAERGLIEGTGPAEDYPPPPVAAPMRQTLFRGQVSLGNPSGLIGWLHAHLGWVLSRRVVIPVAILMLTMEVYVGAHFSALRADVPRLYEHPVMSGAVFALLWLSSGLHELAHGVMCRHFGGDASAVGIRWRTPFVFMYCTVEDVNLFRSRSARIVTAAAGVFVNILFLVPFFVVWFCSPAGSLSRVAFGAMLILGNARAFLNLVPMPPLDGYLILGHAMNLSHFSIESRRYLRLTILSLVRRGSTPNSYPRWVRPVYAGYATFMFVCLVGFVTVIAYWWYSQLPVPYGLVVISGVGILAAIWWLVKLKKGARV
jgi:putative peptide zinc metalloprotease protein